MTAGLVAGLDTRVVALTTHSFRQYKCKVLARLSWTIIGKTDQILGALMELTV